MSRDINIEEAGSWSKKEYEDNVRYLEQRGRLVDVQRVEDVRALEDDDSTSKRSSKAADKETK